MERGKILTIFRIDVLNHTADFVLEFGENILYCFVVDVEEWIASGVYLLLWFVFLRSGWFTRAEVAEGQNLFSGCQLRYFACTGAVHGDVNNRIIRSREADYLFDCAGV